MWSPKLIDDHRLFFGEEIFVGRHGRDHPNRVQGMRRAIGRVGEETRVATAVPEAGTL